MPKAKEPIIQGNYFNSESKRYEKINTSVYENSALASKYVADEIIHCNVNTVNNLCLKGILKKHQIGGRILFKRQEVEDAIVEVKIAKTA